MQMFHCKPLLNSTHPSPITRVQVCALGLDGFWWCQVIEILVEHFLGLCKSNLRVHLCPVYLRIRMLDIMSKVERTISDRTFICTRRCFVVLLHCPFFISHCSFSL